MKNTKFTSKRANSSVTCYDFMRVFFFFFYSVAPFFFLGAFDASIIYGIYFFLVSVSKPSEEVNRKSTHMYHVGCGTVGLGRWATSTRIA